MDDARPDAAWTHGFGGDRIGDAAYFVGGSLTPGDGGATDQLLMFFGGREANVPPCWTTVVENGDTRIPGN